MVFFDEQVIVSTKTVTVIMIYFAAKRLYWLKYVFPRYSPVIIRLCDIPGTACIIMAKGAK